MKLGRFLQTLIDPARAGLPAIADPYAAVEAGRLVVYRLENRCVLAAGPLTAFATDPVEHSLGAAGVAQPLTVVPIVTVPGNQATVEGSLLVFSAATGRLIRVDDPDIGASPLVVDLTAIPALGGPAPSMTLASTAGLTSITGNESNVLRLEGTLANINAALSYLTFSSVDNGDFTVTVTASDVANSEADSASFQVQVANAPPQIAISSGGGAEGNMISGTIEVFDPGSVDNPQVSWVVSYRGAAIAQGEGTSVQFFAAADGDYTVTATAVDKDGGVSTGSADVLVTNISPTVELTGFIRDGVAHLTVFIDDPGIEQFTVEVFWTPGSSISDTFVISERTLTLSHEYTDEELALSGSGLAITVFVSDGENTERETLNFREAAPPEVAPPKFETPPRVLPPERLPFVRPQPTSTTPQIVSSDLGRSVAQGSQEEVASQQFVLRVVGPDGEESPDYPLPSEALEDLPAFLTTLDVPDGHYRVYLVTGELERLVIDAHLRAGHMIDPRDESQPTFDRPPTSQDAAELASQNAVHGESRAMAVANQAVLRGAQSKATADAEFAAGPLGTELVNDVDGTLAVEDGDTVLPLFGGTIALGAAAVGLASAHTWRLSERDEKRGVPRFTKVARWARKLKRCRTSALDE